MSVCRIGKLRIEGGTEPARIGHVTPRLLCSSRPAQKAFISDDVEDILAIGATALDQKLRGGVVVTVHLIRLLQCTRTEQSTELSALIAVGTLIAERPPHRTVRARLRHTAPTLGE